EQILPARTQMREQRRFVLDKLVEATIEGVLLDQRKIFAEQIAHGALLEPQPVQTPFAARVDEPVADQCLEDVPPAGPFARIGQTSRPEAGSNSSCSWSWQASQHAPHCRGRCSFMAPSRICTPWPAACSGSGRSAGNRANWAVCSAPSSKASITPTPGFLLAVVDFAEIEHLALHHLAAGAALALDNAPVPMLLAVLETPIRSQIHGDLSLR